MEGKDLHNDDDQLKSGSDENANKESDDFGLPEAPFDDQKEETSEEPKTSNYSTGDQSDIVKNAIKSEREASANSSDNGKSKSPVGLIVTLILIGVVAVVVAAYFLFLKKDKEPVVQEEPAPVAVDSTLLKIPVEEPVIEEPVEPETPDVGDYRTLTEKTGRYYVVIASFVDSDLAEDYAKKLVDDGVSSTILSPEGRGFYRLALVGDYGSFLDANMEVETVKGNYGPEVWVLKY